MCRDWIKNSKTQVELNLAREVKNKKKGLYRADNQDMAHQSGHSAAVRTEGHARRDTSILGSPRA